MLLIYKDGEMFYLPLNNMFFIAINELKTQLFHGWGTFYQMPQN